MLNSHFRIPGLGSVLTFSRPGTFAPDRLRVLSILAVLLLLGAAGCRQPRPERIDLRERVLDSELILAEFPSDENILRFGFELRSMSEEDAKQYLPFLRYLSEATGCNFQLVFTPKNHSVGDDLGLGLLDLAALSAGSYLSTGTRHPILPIALGLNNEGKPEYRSVTVVAPDSPIQKLEDLPGKSVAFSHSLASFGHLLPRICLFQHGIALQDLLRFEATASHLDCATAVSTRRVDAGIMQSTMGQRLAREGLVRIIHMSEPFPNSCIAGRPDLPGEVFSLVKRALLAFDPLGKDAEGLYHWERTEMPNGFSGMEDADYASLRDWALRLGLMTEPAAPGEDGP